MIHDMLDLVMPTTGTSASLCFGHIDAAGQVFLEPGSALVNPPPPSLVTLQPNSRFAGILQGREGGAQTLLIVGLIGGGNPVPTGTLTPFAGDTAPDGWLLCDGSMYAYGQYPALYSVIGTTYGGGTGTFAVPDLRGRVPVGMDANQTEFSTLSKKGGSKTHTLTVAEMPSHRHALKGYGYQAAGGTSVWRFGGQGGIESSDLVTDAGGGEPHNNLQPYVTTHYIIKT